MVFVVYGMRPLKYVDSGFAALGNSFTTLVFLLLMRILEGKKIQTMSFDVGC